MSRCLHRLSLGNRASSICWCSLINFVCNLPSGDALAIRSVFYLLPPWAVPKDRRHRRLVRLFAAAGGLEAVRGLVTSAAAVVPVVHAAGLATTSQAEKDCRRRTQLHLMSALSIHRRDQDKRWPCRCASGKVPHQRRRGGGTGMARCAFPR